MIKKIAPFFLILIITSNLHGQSCGDILTWREILVNEYPNIITKDGKLTYYRGRYTINRYKEKIEKNLLSDKYVIPFAGKSYMEMSDKQRNTASRRLNNCVKKGKYLNDELYVWILKNIVRTYGNSKYESEFYWQVDWINKKRKEYDALLLELKSGTPSLADLKTFKEDINNKFSVLFSSERKILENLISKLSAEKNKDTAKKNIQDSKGSEIYQSAKYKQENILNRGYTNEATFLGSDKNVSYYYTKQERYPYNIILAIHNIKEDELILDLTPVPEKGSTYFQLKNLYQEKKLIEKIIEPHLPKGANKLSIKHYVEGFKKTQSKYEKESPLISLLFDIKSSLSGWEPYTKYIQISKSSPSNHNSVKEYKESLEYVTQRDLAWKDKSLKIEKGLVENKKYNASLYLNFLTQNGYPRKNEIFWNNLGSLELYIKNIYAGNFKNMENDDDFDSNTLDFVMNAFVNHLSTNCSNLIKKNRLEIEYEDVIPGSLEHTSNSVIGGIVIPEYTKLPDKVYRYTIVLDSRIKKAFEEYKDKRNNIFYVMQYKDSDNFRKLVYNAKKIIYLKKEVACNEKFWELFSENLYRYYTTGKSVQEEKGYVYKRAYREW